jgi:hypothetical protein
MTSISMSYEGALADNNALDMYDAARGLAGFHRSLALTTHLLLNGEIITQAPSLKGAQIISTTPEEGSWKVTAVVLAGLWTVSTAPKDTVPGHLLYSAYDYVIRQSLGFPVDFDKSLSESHGDYLKQKKITAEKLDSLIEKTEASIGDMHRPIVASQSAKFANLLGIDGKVSPIPIGPELSIETYGYLSKTYLDKDLSDLVGIVSSFNVNTYKGRIFVYDEGRPIAFELQDSVKNGRAMFRIANSLRTNARKTNLEQGRITLRGRRMLSSNDRLKAFLVEEVLADDQY